MSINAWEVYITCPSCGKVSTHFDFHENESSERIEYFNVLNGRERFVCRFCSREHTVDKIFTAKYCQVEDLERYKELFWDYIQYAEEDGQVYFSDFDPNCTEEPALSRLIEMYPKDVELKKIRYAYHILHTMGLKEAESFMNLVRENKEETKAIESSTLTSSGMRGTRTCKNCKIWINSKEKRDEQHWCSYIRNHVSADQKADSCARYIDSTLPIHPHFLYAIVNPSPIAIKSLPDRLFCQVPSNQLPFIHKIGVLLNSRGDGIESQFSHIEYYPKRARPLTPVFHTTAPLPRHDYSTLMFETKNSIELLSRHISIGGDWFPDIFDLVQIDKFKHFSQEDPENVLYYSGADYGYIFHEDILFHNPQILTPFVLKNRKDKVGVQDDGYGCWDDITHLVLEKDVHLNDRSFCDCKNLETLTICCELRKIGCDSFCNCPKLRSVRIMHPRTNVYNGCERSFRNCPNLKKIVYADGSREVFFG